MAFLYSMRSFTPLINFTLFYSPSKLHRCCPLCHKISYCPYSMTINTPTISFTRFYSPPIHPSCPGQFLRLWQVLTNKRINCIMGDHIFDIFHVCKYEGYHSSISLLGLGRSWACPWPIFKHYLDREGHDKMFLDSVRLLRFLLYVCCIWEPILKFLPYSGWRATKFSLWYIIKNYSTGLPLKSKSKL